MLYIALAAAVLLLSIALIVFFIKIDCNIYLWILDKICMRRSRTALLKDKVVWITGASSGIGEYIAYEYAKHGSKLALSGTNQDRLDAVKSKCLELNKELQATDVITVRFNITDYEKHRDCLATVLSHFKQIDVLINNAGRSQRAAFEKIDIAVDEEMFRVNVFGPINLTRLVVKHWYDTQFKGQIGITSSVAGIMGAPNSCTYSGTKFALHGYFEALRIESSNKLEITLLCPGPVFSNVLKNVFTETIDGTSNQSHEADSKRMATKRCARLCLTAMVYRVNVAWISIQPVLVCLYLVQYMPCLLNLILNKFMDQDKISRIREGK